jgi:hypothetical protein
MNQPATKPTTYGQLVRGNVVTGIREDGTEIPPVTVLDGTDVGWVPRVVTVNEAGEKQEWGYGDWLGEYAKTFLVGKVKV